MVGEDDRHSRADQAPLVTDPAEKARLEARNALQQFDLVVEMIDHWTNSGRTFKLRASMVLQLHRAALEGLDAYAGTYRPGNVEIGGSSHEPIEAHLVPGTVEELCDYVNEHWGSPPIHLAAYVLWRLNWIHPFTEGNGRTARAVSYLVLCVRLGYRLPGTRTIPEWIAADKKPYYLALEAADSGDIAVLEALLSELLAQQLLEVHQAALRAGTDSQERTLH